MLSLSNYFSRPALPRALGRFFSVTVVKDPSVVRAAMAEPKSNKVLWFTASWCGPCKMITPTVEELSKQFKDVQFLKVDIDEHADLSEEAMVTSVPTFKFFKGVKEVEKMTGADPKSIKAALEKHMA
jgi:thioredoxin